MGVYLVLEEVVLKQANPFLVLLSGLDEVFKVGSLALVDLGFLQRGDIQQGVRHELYIVKGLVALLHEAVLLLLAH